MKKKDRYKIINYAFNEYEEIFKRKYTRKYISPKSVEQIMKAIPHVVLTEWEYCCYGLYENCWQEFYEEGVWGLTQQQVDNKIKRICKALAKDCRLDDRMGYYVTEDSVTILIVARDIVQSDFFITFLKNE